MSYNITTLDIKKLSVDVPLSEFLMELIGSAFREQYTWDGEITWNGNEFVLDLDGDGTEVYGKLKDKDTVNIFNMNISSAFSSDLLETIQNWCKDYRGPKWDRNSVYPLIKFCLQAFLMLRWIGGLFLNTI